MPTDSDQIFADLEPDKSVETLHITLDSNLSDVFNTGLSLDAVTNSNLPKHHSKNIDSPSGKYCFSFQVESN